MIELDTWLGDWLRHKIAVMGLNLELVSNYREKGDSSYR